MMKVLTYKKDFKDRGRNLVSILMLVVFLSANLISSFHHHDSVRAEDIHCDGCSSGAQHASHLLCANPLPDFCLLCSFGQAFYVSGEKVVLSFVQERASEILSFDVLCPNSTPSQVLFLRGPPAIAA